MAGEAARDPDGFDRDALHAVMNHEIVDFFDRKLPPVGDAPDKASRRDSGGLQEGGVPQRGG